uniref:Slc36a-1 n=1 Tax=Schmidtea mediterranea TaxID=79327 RepID=A0A0H3YJI9_SCHMD|nr:slc36a-1 [Schmidtea mediterranea]
MFPSGLQKSQSEDNIPLLQHKTVIKPPKEQHRHTRSTYEIRKSEWSISVDDEEEDEGFNSESYAHNYVEINNLQAVIHVVKCSIGTGVLALPSALRYSGYLLGSFSILILSMINVYSMHLLLEIVENIRLKNPKKILNLDYETTVKLCFENAEEKLQKYVWVHHVLLASLSVAQIGFLSSYQIFVSENTKYIIDYYSNEQAYNMPIWQYQLIYFLVLTPLLFFKTLDKLSYFCQLANVLMGISLIISLVYCYLDPLPIQSLKAVVISDSTLLFFGIVIFSFESINIINPVENNLRDKKKMREKCGILNIAFIFVLPVYLVVGVSGYLRFGDNIASSLILSIPIDKWYFMLCKPFYILSILISYGLQGFVMHNIIWKKIEFRLGSNKVKRIIDILIRIGIGASTTILSVSIPHFDLFISLIGAFSGSSISLIFPAVCSSVMLYSNKTGKFWRARLVVNGVIVGVGIIGCCLGTYSSIVSINRVI